jgi:hypothetical protein
LAVLLNSVIASRLSEIAKKVRHRAGSAIHGCIAAAIGSSGQSLKAAETGQKLSGWKLDGKLDLAQLLARMMDCGPGSGNAGGRADRM